MAYAEYLKNLLAPLGIYDLEKGSISEAMVYAAGQALDQVEQSMERTERESLVATALEEGLERRETLFARAACGRDGGRSPGGHYRPDADRRGQPDPGGHQPDHQRLRTSRQGPGGGHRPSAGDLSGHRRRAAGFDEIEKIVLDILPCHLEVEFYFRYMTWAECEEAGYTWASVEQQEFTWERFELMGGKAQ